MLVVFHELHGELFAEARWGLMGFREGEWVLLEDRGTDEWLRLLRFVRFHPETETWYTDL